MTSDGDAGARHSPAGDLAASGLYAPADPTHATPTSPHWDGISWVCVDATGTWLRWDGTAWTTAAAGATAAPVDPSADNSPRRPRPGTVVVLCVVVVLLLVAAGVLVVVRSSERGSDAASPGVETAPLPAGDDTTPEGVTLAPDVVVVRGGTASVRSVSDDHTRYSFAASAPGATDIATGKVVLLAGIDAGRARSVERHDDVVDVTLDPVAMQEVIHDGDVEIVDSRPVAGRAMVFLGPPIVETDDATEGVSAAPSPALGDGQSSTTSPDGAPRLHAGSVPPARSGMVAVPASAFADPDRLVSVKLGRWEVQVGGRTTASGLDLTLSARRGFGAVGPGVPDATKSHPEPRGFDKDSGTLQLTVDAKLHLDEPSIGSGAKFAGGSVAEATMSMPLTGSIEGSFFAGADADGASSPSKIVARIPIIYEWLMLTGPIPWYASAQLNFLLQPSITTKNTATKVPFRIELSGSARTKVLAGTTADDGTKVSASSKVDPVLSSEEVLGVGALGLVAAVQARFGIGIGTTAFVLGARAGPYIDATLSYGVTQASALALVPCRSVSVNFSVGGGFEAKVKLPADTSLKYTTRVPLYKPKPKEFWAPAVEACAPKR